MNSCHRCKSEPCVWEEHKEGVIAAVELVKSEHIHKGDCPNNICRKYCYRQFVLKMHGSLGKNRRLKLPKCVEDNVRLYYPNETGQEYVGFKDH